MALNTNSAVFLEVQQTPFAFTECTQDTVDLTLFASGQAPWSGRSGYTAVIAPYGVVNGGVITPATSGSDNQVDVSAVLVSMAAATGASATTGRLSVSGTTLTVARPSVDTHLITSITVDTSGAWAQVAGSEGTSYSSTRGANGGPPYIPVDSVEVGQVMYDSQTAAAVLADEISQVDGLSREFYDYPIAEEIASTGYVSFTQAPPTIHTGDVPKKVYVRGYTPVFAELTRSRDYAPAETTHSLSSTTTYDGSVGSVTSTVGQSTLTATLKDGTTDKLVELKNEVLWLKFMQDRNQSPYQLTRGLLGIQRSFVAGSNPEANITISPESETLDLAS